MLDGRTTTVKVAVLTLLLPYAFGGSTPWGGSCSQSNTHLDFNTWNLVTDCDAQTYCADNSTCAYKGCRSDVFPYGYNGIAFDQLPPLCPQGEFCPDEGNKCLPEVPVGGQCQKDRDDECLPPSNYKDLAGMLNTNGTICLNYICYYANRTLSQSCFSDNTRYTGYYEDGREYAFIISRDNCANGYYCDGTALQCFKTLPQGSSCSGNKECSSYNCLSNGKCGRATNLPVQAPLYTYILVGIGIVALVVGTLTTLWFVHRKSRNENQRRLEQYYNEQMAYRQSIMSMHQARKSLFDANGNRPASYMDRPGSYMDNPDSANSSTEVLHNPRVSTSSPALLHPPPLGVMRKDSDAQRSEDGSEVLLVPTDDDSRPDPIRRRET